CARDFHYGNPFAYW
nr:immunoglobulin heavy chain junction region [Mus musculus]